MRPSARVLLALCLLFSAFNALALCSLPQYLGTTLLSPQSVRVNWSYYYNVPTAFQVQYRPENLTSWTSQIVSGTATNATLTNLLDHRDYVWRVRTICSEGDTSAFTALQPFNTACVTPTALGAWSVQHESAQLFWSGNGVGNFQVQYRPVGQATWNTSVVQGSGSGLASLINNTDYEWRVRGICAAGDTSAFSLPATFRTVCPLPTGTATTDITFRSARFSWSISNYGGLSEVHWRAVGSSTWTIVQTNSNYWEANGLANNTTYEWKVRQVCSATAQSGFTPTQVFITQCSPPNSVYTSIIGATTAELSWRKANPLDFIDLRWRAAGAPNWTLAEGLDETDYVLTSLSTGNVYEWQVRSACSATEKSVYSDPVIFQPRCYVPTSLASTSVRHNAATLSWLGSNAELQIRAAGMAAWQSYSAITAPYTVTGLTTNTTYEWRVRSVCAPGNASDFSATQLVTTRCQPPVLSYSNESNVPAALTIRWSGADVVDLQLRPTGTSAWASYTNLSGTTFTFANLTPGLSYEVRAQQRCGPTDLSDYATTTYSVYCGSSLYISVVPLSGSSAVVNWSSGSGQPSGTGLDTLRHDLRWRASGSASWSVVAGITSGSHVLTNLSTNIDYTVQVRRACGATGYTEYESRSFNIPCPTLYNTSVESVSTTSARLNWYVYSSYSPYTLQYRLVGSTTWTTVTGIVSNVYTLTGLMNNTTYEWQVKPDCQASYLTGQSFQTQCGGALANLSVTNLGYNSATLSWQANAGPTAFDVQYRPVGSGSWTVRQAPADEVGGTNEFGAYRRLTLFNLTPGQAYEWRLQALCSAGVQSTVANGPSFTPDCLSPLNLGSYVPVNGSLNIGWENARGVVYTELQWRALGTSNWNEESPLTSTFHSLSGLVPGTTYEYRVRHSCAAGINSAYATGMRLLTCSTPINLDAVRQSPSVANLTWTYYSSMPAVPTPQTVQYRPQGSTDWTTISATTATTAVLGTDRITYAFALSGLASNTYYTWRVRSECGAATADFSYPSAIEASCPPLTYGATVQNSTSVRLSWYAANAPSAVVQWRVAGTPTWTTLGVSSTSYTIANLQPNSSYEWRLITRCGTDSLFTPVQLVRTNCAFTLGNITPQAGADRATVSWYKPFNFAGTYLVQYRPEATAAWTNVTTTSSPVSLTGLSFNVGYQVRVRAVCDANTAGLWTGPTSFRTGCPTLDGLSLFVNSASARTAQFNWFFSYPTAQVGTITIRWREQGTTTWRDMAEIANIPPSSSFGLSGLTPNTTYEYQAIVPCTQGTTVTGPLYTFRTAPLFASTPDLLVEGVTSQAARLRVSSPGSTTYVLQWRATGGTSWQSTQPLNSNTYRLGGLTANTVYETRVMVNGTSYSPVRSFTTSCQAPVDLRTLYATTTEAGLSWTATADNPIQLQWRLAGNTAWTTVTNVGSNSYVLQGLASATTYEWRVSNTCSVGVAALAALPVAFVTNCAPPIRSSITTSGITPTSARLQWTNPSPMFRYTIRYRIADAGQPWTVVPNVAGSAYDLTDLTAGNLYEWNVGQECSGLATEFAGNVRFRTDCQYGTNRVSKVIGGSTVLLTWGTSGSPHEVQVSAEGTTSWTTVTTSAVGSCTVNGLMSGIYYYWRIRPVCAPDGGFIGGESVLLLNCEQSTSPTNPTTRAIRSTSAQLAWTTSLGTPQPDAQRFGVRWRAVGATNWNVLENVSANHTLTGLAVNTDHEWQVRSECATNYVGLSIFRTSCQSPTELTLQQSGTSARLLWNDTGENVPYVLQWRDAGSPTWNTVSGINAISYTLSNLINGATYEWQVRSQCSSTYEATSTFRVSDSRVQSIAAGAWNVPGTWSCTCVPAVTDAVLIRHAVTVPNGYNGAVKTLFYEGTGQLRFGTGAGVRAVE